MSRSGRRKGFVSRGVLGGAGNGHVRRNGGCHNGVVDRCPAELYQYMTPRPRGCTTAGRTNLETLREDRAGANAREEVVEGNSYSVGLSLANFREKTSSGYSRVTDSESRVDRGDDR